MRRLVFSLVVLAVVLGGARAEAASPPTSGFQAAVVGAQVVIEGSGELRLVELPRDGLLFGPGGDMNPPKRNEGAPSTARGVLLAGAVVAGPGCQTVPQVPGVQGFSVLCPLQQGGDVRVLLGDGANRLRIDGGEDGRYYSDVYTWLAAPLEVQGGAGPDRLEVQTVSPALIDGGAGNDRLRLGLSGPRNKLRGGPGNDSFAYAVSAGAEGGYDLTPSSRTRRVDVNCGAGADTVEPHPTFRLGGGCPRPPRLAARPLTINARKRRLLVTVRNREARPVTLRSVRLSIARVAALDSDEPADLILATRRRLRIPARGLVRIGIPSRLRRQLDHQLEDFDTFQVSPSLDVQGTFVDSDGDRARIHLDVAVRGASAGAG